MSETIIADAGRVRMSRLKPLPQFIINLASGSVAAEAAPTNTEQGKSRDLSRLKPLPRAG